jgi:hypothetical protein
MCLRLPLKRSSGSQKNRHNATIAKPLAFFGADNAPTILISRYKVVFEGIIERFFYFISKYCLPIEGLL